MHCIWNVNYSMQWQRETSHLRNITLGFMDLEAFLNGAVANQETDQSQGVCPFKDISTKEGRPYVHRCPLPQAIPALVILNH